MVKISEINFLSTSPGCYMFKDAAGKIIYVGKAVNLRKRVASYFQKKDHDVKTAELVTKIHEVDTIVTSTEVEALILENSLIKKHYPRYNLDLKDSHRYAYLLIHPGEVPWIEVVRYRGAEGEYYGPFVSGAMRKLITDVLSRNFRVFTHKPSLQVRKAVDKEAYNIRIKQARQILRGDVDSLIKELEKKMKQSSDKTFYEYSMTLRNQIEALETLKEKQIIEMTRSVDVNIINYIVAGGTVYLLVFSVRKGILEGKQEYSFDYYKDFFSDFLIQFYDSAPIPQEVIVPHEIIDDVSLEEKPSLVGRGAEASGKLSKSLGRKDDESDVSASSDNKDLANSDNDTKNIEEYLSRKAKRKVKVIVPQKGDKLEMLELVRQNIMNTFFAGSERMTELQKILNLQKMPKTIDCFDISHLTGTDTVASMVRFKDGFPDKSNYRKFKVRIASGGDDYLAMREVVGRRYGGSLQKTMKNPDLIVIDGGLGQLGAAMTVLRELKLNIPVISLAKRLEEIYVPGKEEPLRIDHKNKGLQLLQAIRDEAHRFAITYQRLLRGKRITEK